MAEPFQRLFDQRIDHKWREACGFHLTPVLLDTCPLISDRFPRCFTDRCCDLRHTQRLRTGDLERATLMSTLSATAKAILAMSSTSTGESLTSSSGSRKKAQFRPHPFGEAADCVVCLGRAASHYLEAVQHLRKDIESDFDTSVPGSLGKHPAVIDKGLVASGLQVDRRESSKIRIERACIRIAPVT